MRPRIRTIKPEAHSDEALWDLEIETGFPIFRAFTALWGCADKEGRFEWRPRALKTHCLPYWDGDFSRVLDALATRGFVVRYRVDSRDYGVVRTFKRHQVVNNRESESELPAPPEGSEEHVQSQEVPRVDDACPTRTPRPLSPALVEWERKGRGTEGNGTGRSDCEGGAPAPARRGRKRAVPVDPMGQQIATGAIWDAYCVAYQARYGAKPLRNATVNGQIVNFAKRVPAAEAPLIVEAYLRSNNSRYVAAGHSIGCLLFDAEKLRTEAITGKRSTATAAQRVDKHEDRMDQYAEMFARLDARDAAEQNGARRVAAE